jgi:flagellar export protein FliJ
MPKAFTFQLDPVLRYRRHLEQEKRRKLANARRAVLEQNRLLLDLVREEKAGKQDLGDMKGRGTLSIEQVRLHEQYLNSLAGRIRREYATLQVRLLDEERSRRELAEARKKVRVLERLRERRRAAYDYELARQERKELDEIGLNMFRAGEGAEA